MGCTSSAPNMVTANPNATDKISGFGEDETDQSIKEDDDNIISAEEENGKNEIKVLPSCDTLADPIQLDSNNKSMIDTSNLDMEKDFHTDENDAESVNDDVAKNIALTEDMKTEKKMSSLEDVVEKVVEMFVAENLIIDRPNTPKQVDHIEDSLIKGTEEPEQLLEPTTQESEEEPKDSNEEILEEATSPSQSTSSRATRWEALADIAAELPPSLTVDPVTGQIYALSK